MEFISQKEYEELKNDPIKLFSIINQINDNEKRKQAMLEINNEGSIDICEFAVKAIEGGTDVFMVNVLAGKQAALAAVRGLEAAFPLGGSELSNKA